MLVDAGLCAATCYLSILLRLGFLPTRDTPYAAMIAVSVALALAIFRAFGLYHEIFSHAGIRTLVAVARACAVYALSFATVFTVFSIWGIPRTLSLIQPILLFVAIAASRILARYWLFGTHSLRRVAPRRVVIYGAGAAGRQLAGAIAQSAEMATVGYFDDDPALIGSILDGCRIYAPDDLAMVMERLTADEVLLALPSASRTRRSEIIAAARDAGARIRTLPDLVDLAHSRIDPSQIRDVDIEDLLGREAVAPDRALMRGKVRRKVVMVTGAGGSIGGELCRQLLALEPALLLLFEMSEYGLYEIHRELTARAVDRPVRIVPLLGSVCDEARLDEIVATWRPDIVYHAAAYKHVPLVEHNPAEGIRTNLIGTSTLARVADRWRVPDLTLVSTDKAVRPTNVMGATKRGAELVLQAFNQASATRFSIVRFGNVLGSSGSVVPLFHRQIRAGGPVTITDRRMTRYFMTIFEAAELVLQASAMARGGDVFVLDMGAPVRIVDLAHNMIELAGLSVCSDATGEGDIAIVETGLRPGEKLYEELLIGSAPVATEHPRILKANEAFLPIEVLRARLDRITALLETDDRAALLTALCDLVPEYRCEAGPVDWVHLEGLATMPELQRAVP